MRGRVLLPGFLSAALLLGMGGPVAAAPKQDSTFNPQPAADDFVLPMPGGLEMAFRRIVVPGKDFWYDQRREIKLGDASAGEDPFSDERRVRVMGVFQDEGTDHWWYPIGKYEVSKKQFAAVMGDGDLNIGLSRLAELSGDKNDDNIVSLSGQERDNKLAEPVRWIPWSAVQEFIHKYNKWLFADSNQKGQLPELVWVGRGGKKNVFPGFLRLPSEIEWEYAARGGYEALGQGQGIFEEPLPFKKEEYEAYTWLVENAKEVRPIGTRKPVYGLHDMLGNVSELVEDKFQPELELGKIGGLTVRGGSVRNSIKDLRVGLRAELPIYLEDVRQPGRMMEAGSPFTGFRLVVGAVVYPDNQYRQTLVDDFKTYAKTFRNNTQVASSGAASAIVQSSVPVEELKKQISQLESQNTNLRAQTQQMVAKLQQIQQLQDKEIRTVTFELVGNTISVAAEFGRNYYRWQQRLQVALPAAERLAKISTQHQADYQELLRNTQQYERLVDGNFKRYAYFVERIAQYGPRYIEEALAQASQQQLLPIEQNALHLITAHVQTVMQGTKDPNAWRQQLVQELAQESVVFR